MACSLVEVSSTLSGSALCLSVSSSTITSWALGLGSGVVLEEERITCLLNPQQATPLLEYDNYFVEDYPEFRLSLLMCF